MQYQPPVNGDALDPDRSYVNPNPAASVEGSIPPAEAIEEAQRELVNLINYYLGTVEDPNPASSGDLQQVRKAVAQAVVDGMADALRRTVSATVEAGFWTTPVAADLNAGDISFDTALGNRFFHTATQSLNITAPAQLPAGGPMRFKMVMDAVGGHGVSWDASYRINSGQISADANAVNLIHMEFDAADGIIDVNIMQRAEA